MKRTREIPPIRFYLNDPVIKVKRQKTVCPNPKCHHSYYDKINTIDDKFLKGEVDEYTIDDLISFGEKYHCKLYRKAGNLDLEKAALLVEPLKELTNMVGLTETKKDIVEKVVSLLDPDNHKNDMLHTVVFGPPGVGKTTFSRILPKIYTALGRAKSSTTHYVKVKDLMGEYCGQTQPKVEQAFIKAKGGTLIIDEAYALGNKGKKNVFSEEMINAINQNMDLFRDVNVSFLGYEKPMMENLFAYNDGLFRRIAFVFRLGDYNSKDLAEMLRRKLKNDGYSLDMKSEELDEFMEKHEKEFPYFGGDIETLVSKMKIAVNNRTLFMSAKDKKFMKQKDLEKGMEKLKKARLGKDSESLPPPPIGMYC
jgi:SpoVK/Ycf46/Vps4 family AAA+-type ATPase